MARNRATGLLARAMEPVLGCVPAAPLLAGVAALAYGIGVAGSQAA